MLICKTSKGFGSLPLEIRDETFPNFRTVSIIHEGAYRFREARVPPGEPPPRGVADGGGARPPLPAVRPAAAAPRLRQGRRAAAGHARRHRAPARGAGLAAAKLANLI